MPRGVKGSGKAKEKKTTARKTPKAPDITKEIIATPIESAITESPIKPRRPFPSYEERVAMADQQIARLTKLNAERAALIEKTESKLNDRKDAFAKSTTALEAAIAKKERLIDATKTAEEKAAIKAAKKLEQGKAQALLKLLKEQGKTVEELLAQITSEQE